MKRNPLEWAILVLSVVAIVAILGFLVVDVITEGARPADVVATPDTARAIDGDDGWLVPFIVHNRGGTAARSVQVEVSAFVAGSEEVSELTVDVLAGDSKVELWAGFSGRPDSEISVRITGLEMP